MTSLFDKANPAASLFRARDAGLERARADIDTFYAERQTKLDCKAGCAFCCYHSVACSKAEAMQIAGHIASDPVLTRRVRRAASERAGLDAKRILAQHEPCPLLDPETGMCGVYEIRPIACRGCGSASRNACKRALRGFRTAVPMDMPLFRKATELRKRLAGNADNPQGELAVMVSLELDGAA